MLKEKKSAAVAGLKEVFSSFGSVFITHYHGLNVSQMSNLRAKMREKATKFFIMKNTLLKLGAANSNFAALKEKFVGPVALAISNDPVATAKALVDFANENEKLQLVAASVFGKEVNAEGIRTLSKIPSLDELRATLISLIQSPARTIVSILQAPALKLTRVIHARQANINEINV